MKSWFDIRGGFALLQSRSDGSGFPSKGHSIDFRVSVAIQAAFNVDFPNWLQTLSPLNRCVAEQLAIGETTSTVSEANDVTAGRVSQIRRELAASWTEFHGEGK